MIRGFRLLVIFISSYFVAYALGSAETGTTQSASSHGTSANAAEDSKLKNYDHCGALLNARLAEDDGGHITWVINGVDNPDNSPGWSHGYVRKLPELPTEVDLGIEILLLGGINDEMMSMTTTAMLHMHWVDNRTAVDDDDLCKNLSANFIVNPAKNLPWYPQWIVSNGRLDNVLKWESWEYSSVSVSVDGTVSWRMSFEFVVDCPLVATYFPYDIQLCSIDIASPQYDNRMVKFVVDDESITLREPESQKSPLWQIAGVRHTAVSTSYPSVSFRFMLARRPTYFISALIVPLLAINVMTAFVFLTAANQEEKASSSMACVVAYFFIEVLFFDLTPVSSDSVPILSYFLTFHSYLAVFVLCVSAKLIYYAEYVEENEAIDILLQHDLQVTKSKRTKEDGIRKFRSPEFYNDICFIAYIAVAILSYLVAFSILPVKSNSIKSSLLSKNYSPPHVAKE